MIIDKKNSPKYIMHHIRQEVQIKGRSRNPLQMNRKRPQHALIVGNIVVNTQNFLEPQWNTSTAPIKNTNFKITKKTCNYKYIQ